MTKTEDTDRMILPISFLLISFSLFASTFSAFSFILLKSEFSRKLGISKKDYNTLINSVDILNGVSPVFSGILMDILGTRILFFLSSTSHIIGVIIFFLGGFKSSIFIMIVGKFFQSFALASIMSINEKSTVQWICENHLETKNGIYLFFIWLNIFIGCLVVIPICKKIGCYTRFFILDVSLSTIGLISGFLYIFKCHEPFEEYYKEKKYRLCMNVDLGNPYSSENSISSGRSTSVNDITEREHFVEIDINENGDETHKDNGGNEISTNTKKTGEDNVGSEVKNKGIRSKECIDTHCSILDIENTPSIVASNSKNISVEPKIKRKDIKLLFTAKTDQYSFIRQVLIKIDFPNIYWVFLSSSTLLGAVWEVVMSMNTTLIEEQLSSSNKFTAAQLIMVYLISLLMFPLGGAIFDIFGNRLYFYFISNLLLVCSIYAFESMKLPKLYSLLLFAMSIGLGSVSISTIISLIVPTEKIGTASGISSLMKFLGATLLNTRLNDSLEKRRESGKESRILIIKLFVLISLGIILIVGRINYKHYGNILNLKNSKRLLYIQRKVKAELLKKQLESTE
ncbi:hypothetical protein BB558_001401 [Smittium angustum]|uniref:Lysosomal dipeptide transporter MFSD1 n=1 Tax=Smittium angustum TaxID=133377 RepID=A0A2U1JBI7_SMIAN|nr:hypothetical protein BB558_001401 [Smittium angustum]